MVTKVAILVVKIYSKFQGNILNTTEILKNIKIFACHRCRRKQQPGYDNTLTFSSKKVPLKNDMGHLLTHYHTILHFDAVKKYSCGKHCELIRIATYLTISPSTS